MKKQKFFIFTLIFLIIIIGIMGCSRQKISKINEIVKEKLNERYQEDFEIKETRDQNEFFTLIVYPKSDSTLLFDVSINKDGTHMSDTYVCTLVSRRLSIDIVKNLSTLAGEFYVYSQPRIDTVNIDNKEMSVKEYVEEFPSCAFRTYLFYCPKNLELDADSNKIGQALNGLNYINDKFHIYIVPDNDSLRKIQYYIETHDQFYDEFEDISEDYYKGTIEFVSGLSDKTSREIQEMLK